MSVTVYSKPNCVQCTATYKRLDKLGLELGRDYTVIDISIDHDARDYIMSFGYLQAPVVVAGDTHWSGYVPEKLDAIAKAAAAA